MSIEIMYNCLFLRTHFIISVQKVLICLNLFQKEISSYTGCMNCQERNNAKCMMYLQTYMMHLCVTIKLTDRLSI